MGNRHSEFQIGWSRIPAHRPSSGRGTGVSGSESCLGVGRIGETGFGGCESPGLGPTWGLGQLEAASLCLCVSRDPFITVHNQVVNGNFIYLKKTKIKTTKLLVSANFVRDVHFYF